MPQKSMVISGIGGTIAGQAASVSDSIDYIAAQVGLSQLVAAIAVLAESRHLLVDQVA